MSECNQLKPEGTVDFHMRAEIAEQPELLRRLAPAWQKNCEPIADELGRYSQVAVIGRGSSGNATVFFSYLYGLRTGRQVVDFRPWLTTQPATDTDWSDTAALAFSVSGESTDVVHAARWLRDRGARIIGVTNRAGPGSTLGRVAHTLLRFDVGVELAVPATKTFTAQLFIAAGLCGLPLRDVVDQTADAMEKAVGSDAVNVTLDFLDDAQTVLWVARGPALAGALDAALKLQETAGRHSYGYSSAEVLHGPIGSVDESDRVIVFEDADEEANSVQAVDISLVARGTPFLCVGNCFSVENRGNALNLDLPRERWARTPVFAVLSQQVALEMACRLGLNPDTPLGLRKVTRTL
jgi:glucosamine--fructose-6-phosphate aminotransferase (isomerizing)